MIKMMHVHQGVPVYGAMWVPVLRPLFLPRRKSGLDLASDFADDVDSARPAAREAE